jgi:predicted metal-dependent hydrolase
VIVPDSFFEGVRQLNGKEFYRCHDLLEALWFEAMEPEKSLYQGILQIAVGCYHLENHNLRGATILVGEGVRRLRSTEEQDYAGFDIADFIVQGERLLARLQLLDPDAVQGFALELREMDNFPRLNVCGDRPLSNS